MSMTERTSRQIIDYEKIRSIRVKLEKDIDRNKENAQVDRVVTVKLLENFHKEAKIRNFTVYSDEPEVIGGSNKAPRPTELLLTSLGCCLQSILAIYASSMRISIDSLEMTLRGLRDNRGILGMSKEARVGFYKIEIETRIESKEPLEKIDKLLEVVAEHCPVTDMLTNPVPITNEVVLNGEKVSAGKS